MRVVWTLVRILLVLIALGALLLTPVFVSSPSGTTIESAGLFIDLVALAALVFAVWSIWRGRRTLA